MSVTRTFIVVGVLAGVLVGCGASDETSSTTAPSAAATTEPAAATTVEFVSPIPTIPAADQQAFIDRLDTIAPGLGTEPDDTIENARNTCDSILGGSQTIIESTKTRFIGDGVDDMTDDQAQQIVDLITAEPWCTRPG